MALLIMLVSLTGTFLVWKQQYLWLVIPQARVEFIPTAESLSIIAEAIDRQFDGNEILSVQFASHELPLTLLTLSDERFAYLDTQGSIVDQWQGNGRFEEWVYDLHHRLLLGDTGLNMVGAAAMIMVLLALFGMIAFWPFRKGFRLGLLLRSPGRAHLLLAHRNLGIVVLLPFLLTLVTGIVLVYPAQTEGWLLDDMRRTEQYSNTMTEHLDDISGGGSGDWLPAMQRAVAVFPDATIRSAQVPGSFSGYRIIGLQQNGEWSRQGLSRVYIDSEQGYMDIRMDALRYPLIERIYNTVVPLHTGKLNSFVYKLWLTMVGLGIFALSTMGLTGFVKKYL